MWKQDITEIVEKPAAAADSEAIDLVKYALSNPTYTRFFTDGASGPGWIEWLDQRRYLDNLFQSNETTLLSEQDGHFAFWLADRFMHERPDELFKLIGKHDFQLHRAFLRELCRTLKVKRESHLGRDDLVRWISLLLDSATQNAPRLSFFPYSHILPSLGEICIESQQDSYLLDVFDVMATSYLTKGRRNTVIGHDTETSISTRFSCSFRQLQDLWSKGLEPKLDMVAEPLLERAVERLSRQHRAYRTWASTDDSDHTTSYKRTFIEGYDHGSDPDPVHVLIDVARDCLKYLVSKRREAASTWCDRLVRSEAPILRRLAVNVLPSREDLGLEGKIEWLLANLGLYDMAAHRETFQAMGILYPGAEPDQRKYVIEAVLAYEWPYPEDQDREMQAALEKSKWLLYLLESEPDCVLVKERLECLMKKYPTLRPERFLDLLPPTPNWGPRFFGGPQSTWTAEELLSRTPGEQLDDLLTIEEEGPLSLHPSGVQTEVEKAAIKDFGWGLSMADALIEACKWDSEYWISIMSAWSRELDAKKHGEVLDRLGLIELHGPQSLSVAKST